MRLTFLHKQRRWNSRTSCTTSPAYKRVFLRHGIENGMLWRIKSAENDPLCSTNDTEWSEPSNILILETAAKNPLNDDWYCLWKLMRELCLCVCTRAQGYFVWASHVVEGMRGTNAGLEAALDEVVLCFLLANRPQRGPIYHPCSMS